MCKTLLNFARYSAFLLLLSGITRNVPAWAAPTQHREDLCKRFTLLGELDPGLSDTEKKLVCGGEGAWKNLPFSQAKYNFSNFLQIRGYFHPVFVLDPTDSEHYTVGIGQPTRVTSLSSQGAPDSLKLDRKRKVVGEILTPKLLGAIESWVSQRLGAIGYPCPKVSTQADSETGEAIVTVTAGPYQSLISVVEESIPGMASGMLRRYDAFQLGDLYDGDLLAVTATRVTSLNIAQATYFNTTCEKDGAVARQHLVAGPPRLLTFGVGIDTEGLIQLRSNWRNARIGNRASFAQATLRLSKIDQEINAFINWYHLPFPTRRHLQPSYKLQHRNINAYEIITSRVGMALATTYDRGNLGGQFLLGPVLEFDRTFRGSGFLNPNSRFVELEATLQVQSHSFEYWATDPRSGFNAALVLDFADAALGSSASAQRLNLTAEGLWNYRDYDPPLLIFGLRGGLQSTLSPERPTPSSRIPANFFRYLGGASDLRGFSLQSVPSSGAMTAFYLDPELRFADPPLFGIQPFLFCDFGLIGQTPAAFDSPLLYSPGFGLRYKSPFGVLRTTLARGYPISTPGGWNFYFSLGEEF